MGDALFESGGMPASELDAAEPAFELMDAITGAPDLRSGRWRATPHLDVTTTYDDNIFIQPINRTADVIYTVAPGLAFGFWDYEARLERFMDRESRASLIEKGPGNFLLVDYTAILLGFVQTSSQNGLDQDARLEAQWHIEKLTLETGFHFESKSETDIDIGNRVRRTAFATEVVSNYQATEKTSLEVGFYNLVEDWQDFSGLVEWRNEDYFDYQVTPLLRASLGLALGLDQVEAAADQVFERILGRALYSLSEKLTVEARGGVEFRQSDGAVGDRVNPVFDFRVSYEPAAATRVEVEAYRRVETSALTPDQDYTATGVSVRLRRALPRSLHLSVAGGYQVANYTDSPGTTGRTDHYFFVRPGILYQFAAWGSLELSYQFRENDSTRPAAGFTNSQVTLQASLTF